MRGRPIPWHCSGLADAERLRDGVATTKSICVMGDTPITWSFGSGRSSAAGPTSTMSAPIGRRGRSSRNGPTSARIPERAGRRFLTKPWVSLPRRFSGWMPRHRKSRRLPSVTAFASLAGSPRSSSLSITDDAGSSMSGSGEPLRSGSAARHKAPFIIRFQQQSGPDAQERLARGVRLILRHAGGRREDNPTQPIGGAAPGFAGRPMLPLPQGVPA